MDKKIVVIDDEEILVRSFSKLLEKRGYEVFGFKKGSDAIAFSEEEDIDLIICDIRMPGKNGVETIQDIFAHLTKTNKKLMPVIFATGYADKDIERAAEQLKPVAILRKPFDVNQLLETVQRTLSE